MHHAEVVKAIIPGGNFDRAIEQQHTYLLLPTDQCRYLFITCNLPAHVCLQYTLSSSESASEVLPFTVDRVSGEVTVSGVLDHEYKSEYIFNVTANGKNAVDRPAQTFKRCQHTLFIFVKRCLWGEMSLM